MFRRRKYGRVMRSRGVPLLVSAEEAERLVAHIDRLREDGKAYRDVAAIADVHWTTVRRIHVGEGKTVSRYTYDAVMAVPTGAPTITPRGPLIPAHGMLRRLEALRADGFTQRTLGGWLGHSHQAIAYLLSVRNPRSHAATVRDVAELYRRLAGVDPVTCQSERTTKWARSKALGTGYAPSFCWDDDTIDDPAALPEWTGRCGTRAGYRIHVTRDVGMLNGRLLCEPCRKAENR